MRWAYVNSLCNELRQRATYLPSRRVESVYVGGGTPSLLSADEWTCIWDTIRSTYDIAANAEITVELNPDDVTVAYAQMLRALGVNRVSMGVQTFDDALLRLLNRRHTAQGALAAYDALQRAGFANISMDLIYGLPGQTLAAWNEDLTQMLACHPAHLSAYTLMYEEGTPLFELLKQGRVAEADEEVSAQMFQSLMERTAAAGYEHYEISNFCLPRQYSRHNRGYWTGMAYLGCGAGAHSYNLRARHWNEANVRAYVQAKGDTATAGLLREETLTRSNLHNEMLLTSLRTREGLPLQAFRTQFGEQALQRILQRAQKFPEQLELTATHLHLTREGIFVSDMVISDLMEV